MPLTALREQPFRLFFPLGAIVAVAGVLPWLLLWLQVENRWLGSEHALAQLQGFLPCLAAGFLFTMLPRRTRTASPGPVPLALAALGFPLAAAAGLRDAWLVAQASYALGLCGLLGYALAAQWRPEGRRTPDAFALLPLALVQGLVGAGLLAASSVDALGRQAHLLGRLLVQEGVFMTLMLGVGSFVVPLFTGHEAPPDSSSTTGSRLRRIGHAGFALLLVGSFVVQVMVSESSSPELGTRWGYSIRFVLVLGFVLGVLRLHRRPLRRGTARNLLWLAYWLMPLSLGLVALMPSRRIGLLHLLLAGAFSLATLSVAAHVSFGHGGREDLRDGTSWWLRAAALLILAAAVTRITADFLPKSFLAHLGSASALWLLGLACWAVPQLPTWWRGAPEHGAH